MLFPLLIDAAHDIAGLAPATLFEQATGVSRMTFHRGKAYAALQGPKQDEIERHRDAWLLESMRSRGATEEEAAEALAASRKPVSTVVHGLTLLDSNCSDVIRSLAEDLDEADVRMCRLVDREDLDRFAQEPSAESPLGPAYSAPLDVPRRHFSQAEGDAPCPNSQGPHGSFAAGSYRSRA